MDIRFYVDHETNQPHIFRHGISKAEVEQVLARPGEDRPGHEGARVALGRTSSGRYLRVIYTLDQELGSVFVITAYEIRGNVLTAYQRRRRKKR